MRPEALQAESLSTAHFIRQFGNELANFDFKSLRSVVALFKPGHIAAEFLAGRRVRYLNPLKLYFPCAAPFFLVAPNLSGFNLKELLQQDSEGTLHAMVQHRMDQKQIPFARFEERFNLRLQTVYTLGLGLSGLAVALILRVLYRGPGTPMGTHIVFALYYVSFFYLAALVWAL